jgi:acetyl-CoA decarbonylase/synthase, CODH/ACS complex subunit gamma
MALTGLQIQKLLPKTNCKECGSNTCLAFAMKLAAKKADLSECPYASDEAKAVLGAASEPPVKGIAFGADKKLVLGEETVLYRHEKTFVHQTALAVNINDNDSPSSIDAMLSAIKNYVLERVGETLIVDMVAVTNNGGDAAAFAALAKKTWEAVKRPLIIKSASVKAMKSAAEAVKGSRGILCAATPENADELKSIAEENGHVLAVTATDMDSLHALTTRLKAAGFNDLVLQFQTGSFAEQFQTNSIARRGALKDQVKAMGYPTLRFIEPVDDFGATSQAISEIIKYGGVCVLPKFDPALLCSLMTLRQNIYTDPQKPIQVEPKIYQVGEPKSDSPVFVTTNFSLTYFIVSGEIENSGTSAWLVIPECEGMSVLTAWAAGKFSGASIAKFIKGTNLEATVTTRDIIIPGYVSQISGELEENMHGWKVVVGPQEAVDIESFIKAKIKR